MISLSSLQWAQFRKLPEEFGLDYARKLKQTTLGSFGARGYVKRYGNKFRVTSLGREARDGFGHEEIHRKNALDKLSIHFREVLEMSSHRRSA